MGQSIRQFLSRSQDRCFPRLWKDSASLNWSSSSSINFNESNTSFDSAAVLSVVSVCLILTGFVLKSSTGCERERSEKTAPNRLLSSLPGRFGFFSWLAGFGRRLLGSWMSHGVSWGWSDKRSWRSLRKRSAGIPIVKGDKAGS